MDLAGLIDAYREESHDHAKPPFMSNERLAQIANEAQIEACRRASLIVDSTADFCAVPVTAGDPLVELDSHIIDVKRIRISTSSLPLAIAWTQDMDERIPGWESHHGTPTNYITDYQTGLLRLYPIPDVPADVRMTVNRLPLKAMDGDHDEPEIRAEYHPALVQWMLHKAYAKNDTDQLAPEKSAQALSEFEKEFGKRSSARNESWQRERNHVSASPVA